MLSFPIVDTHVHLWDPNNIRYPWLDNIPSLNKPYLLEDFNRVTGPVRVDKIVFLQCDCEFSQFMAEAEWVTGLAAQDPRIEGMVPWAPLEKGDKARADLEKLAENKLVKGVRRLIQSEPVEFCLQPDFVKGVQALADYNLSFDICIYHIHLVNIVQMVKQCPNVNFILDHIGKPDIKNQLFEPWQVEIKRLSELPNVWCKVSGLVTEADREKWTKEDLKPYIDHVISCFGFDRVIYGGDWPVATLASDYPRWVETLLWAVEGATVAELRKLFRENAISFYKLA
jgi:L-fuconolactonase